MPQNESERIDQIFKEIWADDGIMGPVVMGLPEAKAKIAQMLKEARTVEIEYVLSKSTHISRQLEWELKDRLAALSNQKESGDN